MYKEEQLRSSLCDYARIGIDDLARQVSQIGWIPKHVLHTVQYFHKTAVSPMAAQWLQTYLHVCLSVGRPHAGAWRASHQFQGGSPQWVFLQVEKDPDDPLLVMQGIQ